MTSAKLQAIFRKDYRPPTHFIDRTNLEFELGESETIVRCSCEFRRNVDAESADTGIKLDGEDLKLRSIAIDGRVLGPDEYRLTEAGLELDNLPEKFVLSTEVAIHPESNTYLSGLYRSNGIFCSQCEAEGFRRITYYFDRPDVMSVYETKIIVDGSAIPVALSNGNCVKKETLPDGRTCVTWQDPFPKPAYLFALVAGNLHAARDTFTTRSGREVALEIWVEKDNLEKCQHALDSLKQAMRWDEEVFGLEYDLDVYMIVAVSDFNMGAMENKGLNVFNTKYVLAQPETATDDDYEGILGVIAHEYFHNWTGNRVTCRDWFQLTLKEGLTVYRDQQFTSDMTSSAVKRIQDVRRLQTVQYAEDAGPMAHPIRPEQYVEMNNFYTPTVYEKGAEVVRMYETLLGKDGFRRGMDLYFKRHDGQAVTCDDFRAAMADANNADFSLFENWYSDAGTPVLKASDKFDANSQIYELVLEQSEPVGAPLPYRAKHIPVTIGLLDADGNDLPLTLEGEEARPQRTGASNSRTLELKTLRQSFRFTGMTARPVPSVLRQHSAPVRKHFEFPTSDKAFLLAHDSDPLNRWDAGQQLAQSVILASYERIKADEKPEIDTAYLHSVGRLLADPKVDPALKALTLGLPEEKQLVQELTNLEPDHLRTAREHVRLHLAQEFQEQWRDIYRSNSSESYSNRREDIGRRRLKNAALTFLAVLPEGPDLAFRQYRDADNMTDRQAALIELANVPGEQREIAFRDFARRYETDALVMDKWFAVQALSYLPDIVERVSDLICHPLFRRNNPNRFRSLIGNFALNNLAAFHQKNGDGYRLVGAEVRRVDAINPQIAARIVAAFNSWKMLDEARQALMCAELERISIQSGLSRDVGEIVARALAQAEN